MSSLETIMLIGITPVAALIIAGLVYRSVRREHHHGR